MDAAGLIARLHASNDGGRSKPPRALDEMREERRAVFHERADRLHADGQAIAAAPDRHARCRLPADSGDAGPHRLGIVRMRAAVDSNGPLVHRGVIVQQRGRRHGRAQHDVPDREQLAPLVRMAHSSTVEVQPVSMAEHQPAQAQRLSIGFESRQRGDSIRHRPVGGFRHIGADERHEQRDERLEEALEAGQERAFEGDAAAEARQLLGQLAEAFANFAGGGRRGVAVQHEHSKVFECRWRGGGRPRRYALARSSSGPAMTSRAMDRSAALRAIGPRTARSGSAATDKTGTPGGANPRMGTSPWLGRCA